MNKVILDFPQQFQKNAFGIWMETEGFELFKKYYADKMPEEPQPHNSSVEFESGPNDAHYITIE